MHEKEICLPFTLVQDFELPGSTGKFWFISWEMSLRKMWQYGRKRKNTCTFSLPQRVRQKWGQEVSWWKRESYSFKLSSTTSTRLKTCNNPCFSMSHSSRQVKGSQSCHVSQIPHGTWSSVMPPHILGRRSLAVLLENIICLTGTRRRPKVKQSQVPGSVDCC